jgi:methylenetetrahydrofolate dehydrogenase (NADP+)/methenyltetrahydrofolate cyclohydrolase
MIDCKKIANEIKEELKQIIQTTESLNNITPRLAIIQVGDNPASNNYVKGKIKDCEEIGIIPSLFKLEESVTEDRVIELIERLNANMYVHGIIVQLPLPSHLNEKKITNTVIAKKDVDGFVPNSPFTPCTPLGVLTLLDKLNIDIKGKLITLVGYGKLVNKPLFPILSDMGATVCVCRSNTSPEVLSRLCYISDIVISAVGKHNIIKGRYLNYRSIVIDCGINVINGKQYGDCTEGIYRDNYNVTPRIGGMGLMTRAALMMNVVRAWKDQTNE